MTNASNLPLRILFILVLGLSSFQIFSQTDADLYCTANNGCGTYISDVTIGTLVNNGTACSSNGYGNYTTMSYSAVTGSVFNISVTASGATGTSVLKIYIDWNKDYDLTDAGESIALNGSPGAGPYTANVTVPMNANIGFTRIRIRIGNNTVTPCTYAAVGETEDYTLNILPAITVNSVSPSILCVGSQVYVAYTTTITFNPGNVFTLQLSDDYGSFASPTDIGTISNTGSGVMTAVIPNTVFFGTAYRLRIVANDPVCTSLDNGQDLIVSMPPDLQLNPPTICAPVSVDITTIWTDINYTNCVVNYWADEACTLPIADPTSITVSGTYYIQAIEVDGGCIDIEPVVVAISESPVVYAGSNQVMIEGDSVQLTGSATGGTTPYTVTWFPVEGLSNSTIFQPWAYPNGTITYTLIVTDVHGCVGTDDVIVAVGSGLTGTVQGNVKYANNASTPMTNTTVYLKNSIGVIVYQTTTDANGNYGIIDVSPGTYTLSASCSKPWGGVNAIDALLIMKHFVAMTPLSGIKLTVADVDGSGFVNAIDALTAMKRFVGMQTSFVVGNWAFEEFSVTVDFSQTITQNIKALCFGDVDGSFTPSLIAD